MAHYFYLGGISFLDVDIQNEVVSPSSFWLFNLVLVILYTICILPLVMFAFGFLAWTTYLILCNKTTMESSVGSAEDYNLGFISNIKHVLGPSVLFWLVPTSTPVDLTPFMMSNHLKDIV